MKQIRIILNPDRKNVVENNIKFSDPNCAAVTLLITDDDKKILIDSGAYGYADTLIKNLQDQHLSPPDIDYVILTHAHFDHNANLYLFSNAELVYHKWLVSLRNGKTMKFSGVPKIPADGIEIISTPGHTEDSISVLCRYENQKYAIVGDAVKLSLIKSGVIDASYSNPQQYLNNMKRLCDVSDVLITGEDGIVMGNQLIETRTLLNQVTIQ